ncbi:MULTISPECIES: phosphomannomutase [unclassified Aliiroseovarius]|uniref:phosphomannomutase n=1 Tax=unclassified Aliiroseovarius TaxID=2623558 RepID=UPI0015685AEE|nr:MULTISPECIES: phosphomannomutase [unclassified Aliiroseovarius]NRP13426.1 Phosphomannomutase/phosphoglucomutase [Aliiroseovarius sp. xm-d-517]NRP40099.1 Phosphomannomutase/phosphoglucomutase [Aliiroseovarius sp. xm-m-339-2]NRP61105.1 Phosphomannomutase/phosphoglucomutase [Aliiroseovarius sp. xm-a-151]
MTQSAFHPMTCFKAYDIRGRLGEELNEGVAERIARAFAQVLQAKKVVLGHDPRASSTALSGAVCKGLMRAGVTVVDLGLCGTEEVYFGTDFHNADGGICVTASHNPMDYNGMKMVKAGAAPLDPQEEFARIKTLAERGEFTADLPGGCHDASQAELTRAAYVQKVLSFVDVSQLAPMKVVVNAGNGAAGPSFDAIATAMSDAGAPVRFCRMHHQPDGRFPNGIPNPLLPENQPVTAQEVLAQGADLGIAWDGDFDRCFLFDHEGQFVPGEYVVGLLAESFLSKDPDATIVHDPRVIWNTQDLVNAAGGQAIMARTGHAFVKQVMRDTGAIYGGEMSAHHYFRDFMACDSGMIPWLLVIELLSRKSVPLADLIRARRAAFPSSGEINFRVENADQALTRVEQTLGADAIRRDDTDGMSLDFGAWRLNLRRSNTEPLLRLNVETCGDLSLLAEKVDLLRQLLSS